MKLNEGVEWALHCTTVLAFVPPAGAMPAAKLAEFHGVPPAYLAKSLQALARGGIVESVPGRRGGYRLGRPASGITILDVVEAVEGRERSFRCTEIRRRGPAKVRNPLYSPVCAIADVMYRADEAWRAQLRATTIADLLDRLATTVPMEAVVKGATWMQDAIN